MTFTRYSPSGVSTRRWDADLEDAYDWREHRAPWRDISATVVIALLLAAISALG